MASSGLGPPTASLLERDRAEVRDVVEVLVRDNEDVTLAGRVDAAHASPRHERIELIEREQVAYEFLPAVDGVRPHSGTPATSLHQRE